MFSEYDKCWRDKQTHFLALQSWRLTKRSLLGKEIKPCKLPTTHNISKDKQVLDIYSFLTYALINFFL